MLKELGPEDPITNGRLCVVAAAYFLIVGLKYKQIAEYIQRRSGQSDRVKMLGVKIMRPLAFLMVAISLLFAIIFFFGQGAR